MKYTLSYDKPNTQYVPVKCEFNVDGRSKILLQFPVWRPGRYERADFAKNIHSFQVTANGKKIPFQKISKDQWEIECKDTETIVVSYKYFAAELNAGSTFMDDQQLYVNPVNCLAYLPEQINDTCKLTLEIPDDFQIASAGNFNKGSASFKNYHELVDTPFIASKLLKHMRFSCKEVTFHLWFMGTVQMDDKVIVDLERYTASQIEKFGGFPVAEYHYLYQIQNIPAYHGVEHQTGTVISLGPSCDLMGKLYNDFLGVSSHELYHTWNVKALRPLDWFPYDYSRENYSVLGYVAEGVTTYMGDLILVESGVKDWEWYQSTFENLMQKHFDNFGRFNYSVAASGFDSWLDGYVQGAPNRKVSIYTEGALLSFMLDMKIRTNSNNKASLHDVMKELYDQFALNDKGYTATDFKGTVEKFAEEDLSDFFDHYYYGTYSFESVLSQALEQAGMIMELVHNRSWATRILGVMCATEKGKTVVKKIYPGSSADLGGIMLGDEIIFVNQTNVDGNIDQLVEHYQNDQIELDINRKGRRVNVNCPHTNKSFFPEYRLKNGKAPSNLQKRIFKKWCGTDWDEVWN